MISGLGKLLETVSNSLYRSTHINLLYQNRAIIRLLMGGSLALKCWILLFFMLFSQWWDFRHTLAAFSSFFKFSKYRDHNLKHLFVLHYYNNFLLHYYSAHQSTKLDLLGGKILYNKQILFTQYNCLTWERIRSPVGEQRWVLGNHWWAKSVMTGILIFSV